ncbi:MAG: FAD-dependent oxidoreductase [Desertifilum sp. SIO1I2]|nr:FAD-dependent oxidoreductase [Desertifilum sp. SIO1I2]
MVHQVLTVDVLVVGGGTGGTAAAIQAARCGVKTALVSEFPWLGGMLTSAGVSVPDGNELNALQTGLWGAFLRELQQRQPGGLDWSWVSFFSFDPRLGAEIFAEWVAALPNLHWICGQAPQEVKQQGDRIVGVRFEDWLINAQMTLDATELGDVLALAEIPHRWGWEYQSEFNEPSAPIGPTALTQRYPVQVPTWVFLLQDYGEGNCAPKIPASGLDRSEHFRGAWDNYGPERFLSYGRLPDGRMMINWPIRGNDYGEGVGRLVESPSAAQQFRREAYGHSLGFAHWIQQHLGSRYGLAEHSFPHSPLKSPVQPIHSGFALHPYYRESRRLQGLGTVTENEILPLTGGRVATLPANGRGEVSAIAIGNYANDHHYPSGDYPLAPKSIRWGGRWTGTPFAIPYEALIPQAMDGLLACEKNISVSHIANGATRLQPVVLNTGQAAGMAAALCVQQGCQPRELSVRGLQEALLTDAIAPAAVIPLYNLPPNHPRWLDWQRYYLASPEQYPPDGNCPDWDLPVSQSPHSYSGLFQRHDAQTYTICLDSSAETWKLVTLDAQVDRQLQAYGDRQPIHLWGRFNSAGNWLLVEKIGDRNLDKIAI